MQEDRQMRKLSTPTLCLILWLVPANIAAQGPEQRAQEILASFNKSKHALKEKHGVRREKYKEIRSEPDLRQDVRDYSGTYEVLDLGYRLEMQVASDGSIKASGYEPARNDRQQARRFTLEAAKIQGALLTATKVYEGGTAEKFEGVFIRRTDFNSPTDVGVSTFGLGVVGQPVEIDGLTLDKLFYQMKQ
jgi:hypothetical protein